jgi:toxin CcdB
MAQFDVYQGKGKMLLVDCQSDLLDHLDTRFVVPLILSESTPPPMPRLTPIFELGRREYVMATQYAASYAKRELGRAMFNLDPERERILSAIDMLTSGF